MPNIGRTRTTPHDFTKGDCACGMRKHWPGATGHCAAFMGTLAKRQAKHSQRKRDERRRARLAGAT